MVQFKACPKCRGDMHVNRDVYGSYKKCLQCGLMEDIQSPRRTRLLAAAGAKKAAVKVA